MFRPSLIDIPQSAACISVLRGHTDCINSVAISPDGKYIASASDDETIRIWNTSTGKALGKPFQGHTDSVMSVTFSPDGKRIVSGSNDRTVRIWDVETGTAVGGPFQGHRCGVTSVAFSPDGKHIDRKSVV